MDLVETITFTQDIAKAVHSAWPLAVSAHDALSAVKRMTSAKCELNRIKVKLTSDLSYDCGKYMIYLTHTGEMSVIEKNGDENFTTQLLQEHKVLRTTVEEITVYTPFVEPTLEQLAMCAAKVDNSQIHVLRTKHELPS